MSANVSAHMLTTSCSSILVSLGFSLAGPEFYLTEEATNVCCIIKATLPLKEVLY